MKIVFGEYERRRRTLWTSLMHRAILPCSIWPHRIHVRRSKLLINNMTQASCRINQAESESDGQGKTLFCLLKYPIC